MATFNCSMSVGGASDFGMASYEASVGGWQIGGGDDCAAYLSCELPDDYSLYSDGTISGTFYAASSVRSSWSGEVLLQVNGVTRGGSYAISGSDFSGSGHSVSFSINTSNFLGPWDVDEFEPGDTVKLVFYNAEDQFVNSSGNCLYLKSGGFSSYATKEITLYFSANGGSGAPGYQELEANSYGTATFTIPTTTPTRDGYTFLGWSLSSSATSASYYGGGNIQLTDDDTLYAVWQKNATYTLTFNYDDGVSDLTHVTVTADVNGVATYDIPSDAPTRDGYIFLGWTTDYSGTFAEYEPGDSIEISESTMLYAVWTQIITVNVRKNDVLWADCAYTLELYLDGVKQYTLTNDGTGKYTAYSIDDGTYDLYISGENVGIIVPVVNDLSLTPVTVDYYTVVYQAPTADGGTVPNDINVYIKWAKATIAHNVGGLIKTDYVFVGWNTSEDGTGTHYNPGDVVSMTAGLSLYAIWREATKAYLFDGAQWLPGDPLMYNETWKSTKMCMYTTEWNS